MDERTYEEHEAHAMRQAEHEFRIKHAAKLAELDAQRARDIRDCLTAYRNAYDIEDGQQLERANRLFSELTLSGQAEVRRVLYREFRRMVA